MLPFLLAFLIVGAPATRRDCRKPEWDWEGCGTSAWTEWNAMGLRLSSKIDISGPPWLYLSLQETPYGLLAIAYHDHGDWTALRWYPSGSAFLDASDPLAVMNRAMMRRAGVPRWVLLRHEPAGDTTALLEQLEADDWRVRQRAMDALQRHPLPLLDLACPLTAAQRAGVETVLSDCLSN